MRRQQAPVKRDGKKDRKAGFACVALLTSTLATACGSEVPGLKDTGPAKKDAGVAQDSGVNVPTCRDIPTRQLTCDQPLTEELSEGEIMSAGDNAFVRLDSVHRDEYGLSEISFTILSKACGRIFDGTANVGFIKRVEIPHGARLTIAAMTASTDEKKANIQVQDVDCERTCSTSDEVVRTLAELESAPLDTSLGSLSVNFDQLDENIILTVTVAYSSGTPKWSMYLVEGNTGPADFWNAVVEVTPWNVDVGSRRALFQITVSDCISQ